MIADLLAPELVLADLRAATGDEALEKLAEHAAANVPGLDAPALARTLALREAQASTAPGDGVAIPHARIPGLGRMIVVVARSASGIDWNAPDGQPVHLAILLAGPAEDPGKYLKTLAAISRLMRDEQCRARLMRAATADELFRVAREEAVKSAASG